MGLKSLNQNRSSIVLLLPKTASLPLSKFLPPHLFLFHLLSLARTSPAMSPVPPLYYRCWSPSPIFFFVLSFYQRKTPIPLSQIRSAPPIKIETELASLLSREGAPPSLFLVSAEAALQHSITGSTSSSAPVFSVLYNSPLNNPQDGDAAIVVFSVYLSLLLYAFPSRRCCCLGLPSPPSSRCPPFVHRRGRPEPIASPPPLLSSSSSSPKDRYKLL